MASGTIEKIQKKSPSWLAISQNWCIVLVLTKDRVFKFEFEHQPKERGMRSINEIKKFAEGKGMEVEVRERGASYRAGGDVVCYPIGFDWRNSNVSIKHEPRFGFEGTGYAGRGRWYDLWLVVPAKDGEKSYKLVEYTTYANVDAEKRLCIGNEEEGRSGCDGLSFIESAADKFGDLEDLFAGWTA